MTFKILKIGIALFFSGLVFATTTSTANEYIIDQQNKTFIFNGSKIEDLTIDQGDTIRFKNEDPFFHNIFSLSNIKTFDLGSFPKGQSKIVKFNKKGTLEIECAIHPQMYLEVKVK